MPQGKDDPTIRDSDRVLRRIPRWHIVWDDNVRSFRISSAAFENPRDGSGMSVSIESLVPSAGAGYERVLRNHPDFGLVALDVALVRKHGQRVIHCPLPDDHAHGEVVGNKPRSVRKTFAREAIWIKALDLPGPSQ